MCLRTLAASLALLVSLPLAAPSALAQPPAPADRNQAPGVEVPPPDVIQELTLKDGTVAVGRIERVDNGRVVFRSQSGTTIEADIGQVAKVRTVAGRSAGTTVYPEDPNPTRLFFGPTGRSLERGEGYVGVYEVFLPFVQVGLTDRISIGAGTPLLFGSDAEHPFWVTPKVQVLAYPTLQASVGVMHFMNVGDGNLGIAYGAVTKGTSDTAITVGGGYAYTRTSGEIEGAGLAMIGAEHRVSRRVKILTENYVFDGGALVSAGVRFMGEHLSADLGLVTPLGFDETVVFPMVNFVWKF